MADKEPTLKNNRKMPFEIEPEVSVAEEVVVEKETMPTPEEVIILAPEPTVEEEEVLPEPEVEEVVPEPTATPVEQLVVLSKPRTITFYNGMGITYTD